MFNHVCAACDALLPTERKTIGPLTYHGQPCDCCGKRMARSVDAHPVSHKQLAEIIRRHVGER